MSLAMALAGPVIVMGAAILAPLAGTTRPDRHARAVAAGGAVLALLAALGFALQFGGRIELFGGGLVLDAYSGFVGLIVALCGAAVLVLSMDAAELGAGHRPEYVSLVCFAVLGAALMASTTDFAAFFLALQLSSIPLYVLSGFQVGDRMATEAAFKFLLLGMVVSAVVLYGFSVGFAESPSTSFAAMGGGAAGALSPATTVALIFVLAGFMFKVGAAPLHFWIPDTYQGSATPVTTLLATVPKAAAVAALVRFSALALAPGAFRWAGPSLAVLAVVSMTLGNLIALLQTDVKRLLAYSAIAQVGYIMVAPAVALGRAAAGPVLFYAAVYALTGVGAFAVVLVAAEGRRTLELKDLSGLWQRSPLAAGALLLFVISLLGLPPTPGFWAKFGIISLAIGQGAGWLATAVVINSLISVAYYVRIVRHVFVSAPTEGRLAVAPAAAGVIGLVVALNVVIGLWPSGLEMLAQAAARAGLAG